MLAAQAQAKEQFARLVGGDPGGVSVVPSAAHAVGLAAANVMRAVGGDDGAEVVILEDHYSNALPWQAAAARAGAMVVPVRRSWGSVGAEDVGAALAAAVGPRTVAVAAAPVGWTDGSVVDLRPVAAACRRHGAALVLDATQWVGAAEYDAAAVGRHCSCPRNHPDALDHLLK